MSNILEIRKFGSQLVYGIHQILSLVIDLLLKLMVVSMNLNTVGHLIEYVKEHWRIWAIAFNSQLRSSGNWTTSYFKDTLSNYDQRLVTNQCAMERLLLQLLGLNLCKQDDGAIDFEHHSMLFNKA